MTQRYQGSSRPVRRTIRTVSLYPGATKGHRPRSDALTRRDRLLEASEVDSRYARLHRAGRSRSVGAIFWLVRSKTGLTASVKSFGRRQAYESPRGRNPRATGDGYGDFDLRLVSAMTRPPLGSDGFDADGPLRLSTTLYCRLVARPDATPSASMITTDTRGSAAGG
jgi:hypothetical protein